MVVRWIASERNPSDEPSRRFEKRHRSDPQKLQPSSSEGDAPGTAPPFAAGLVWVGDGVAVLTGAHPELTAAALSTGARPAPAVKRPHQGFDDGGGLDPMVLGQLRDGEDGRRKLFERLLLALRL